MVMGNCHCRGCQQATGSAYNPAVIVPAATLEIKGEPKTYSSQNTAGNTVYRAFCGDCGSPLFSYSSSGQDVRIIKAGSLDDPSWYKPMADIWTSSAQPWAAMDQNTMKFEENAAGG
jgi:hypothetical protein